MYLKIYESIKDTSANRLPSHAFVCVYIYIYIYITEKEKKKKKLYRRGWSLGANSLLPTAMPLYVNVHFASAHVHISRT